MWETKVVDYLFFEADHDHNHNHKFPPYDLYVNDNGESVLEVALAGYDKEDIEVLVDKYLEVKTSDKYIPPKTDSNQYSKKMIARRKFSLRFDKKRNKVKSCKMDNGLLRIILQVPKEEIESKKVLIE